jgi:hypothetical protein
MPSDGHIALRQLVYQAGDAYHAVAFVYWTEGRDCTQLHKVRTQAAAFDTAIETLRVYLAQLRPSERVRQESKAMVLFQELLHHEILLLRAE